jgi:electron transfer flavoprotein beta subunit
MGAMNLFVLLKTMPDTVEELTVGEDGKSLDPQWLRFKFSDADEHALEQAFLLKERHGGKVTVVALDAPEVDEALFMALAKGADRVVKLAGDLAGLQSGSAAGLFAEFLKGVGQPLPPDTLILLRGQASDELEGEIAPLLAHALGLPFVSVVTAVSPEGNGVSVVKEFSGGLRGEFALPLPAVLGIQSAEKPPRYVPIAKVRAAMKTARIETVDVAPPGAPARCAVERMYKPEVAGRAQMLEGTPDEVADRLVQVLVEQSLI